MRRVPDGRPYKIQNSRKVELSVEIYSSPENRDKYFIPRLILGSGSDRWRVWRNVYVMPSVRQSRRLRDRWVYGCGIWVWYMGVV